MCLIPAIHTDPHISTENALKLCAKKRLNNLDASRAHTSTQTHTVSLVAVNHLTFKSAVNCRWLSTSSGFKVLRHKTL